jgi:chromosome segregation ATPase
MPPTVDNDAKGDASMSLKMLHLEAESASARASASTATAQLARASARANALEALLEETEAETLTLKARADAAESARNARDAVIARLQEEATAAATEAAAARNAAEELREAKLEGERIAAAGDKENADRCESLESRIASLIAEAARKEAQVVELKAALEAAALERDAETKRVDEGRAEVTRLESFGRGQQREGGHWCACRRSVHRKGRLS